MWGVMLSAVLQVTASLSFSFKHENPSQKVMYCHVLYNTFTKATNCCKHESILQTSHLPLYQNHKLLDSGGHCQLPELMKCSLHSLYHSTVEF